ncbi:MAG: patatin-like phospholipase family protein [Oleispira sp.]|nr:patatin-like phospholipase family protein [Oleispira sp.]MBL4880271.1 patatin-like phospholipase family protein [Oleispira sp.]
MTGIDRKKIGLILSGGGARAAYQVGVLKAIHKILPKNSANPYDIIAGTSAGAINSVALASYAENYRIGMRHLERIWTGFSPEQIYRTDFWGITRSLLRLLRTTIIGRRYKHDKVSLLDNTPLRNLLSQVIQFDNIQKAIDNGALHAISVTGSGLESGESVSFFQGHYSILNWQRHRRIGYRSRVGVDHLLASSAIPMIFPSIQINKEYYADGAVRQLAPISPALHLGAEKVLVIGVSGIAHKRKDTIQVTGYPTPAKILGHMLNAAFLDSMETDVERLQRINRTVNMIPENLRKKHGMDLKPIELLEINPSASLDEIAGRHAHELPRALRFFIGGSGNSSRNGSGILSYLLFSSGFCKDLIALGYKDGLARREEIEEFFADHMPIADSKNEKSA